MSQTSSSQFNLLFLFFVLTACAITFAILRVVTGLDTVLELRAIMMVYVLGFAAYVIVRVPIKVRPILRRQRELRAQRAELSALVNAKRDAEAE